MSVAQQTAKCPYCLESVKPKAKICKHCHSELRKETKRANPVEKLNNFRTGFLTGVLFSLIMALLIYLQFGV